jgi:hypothetical protein
MNKMVQSYLWVKGSPSLMTYKESKAGFTATIPLLTALAPLAVIQCALAASP